MACANLKTVHKVSKNQIIRKVLKKINFPLAMPSANKSKSISPQAQGMFMMNSKKIKVVDGGFSKIGVESTVVNLVGKISILRPGKITPAHLKIFNKKINFSLKNKKILSPGYLKKHYSPNIPVLLNKHKCPQKYAFITFGKRYPVTRNTFNLSKKSNLNEAARNLFKTFRKIKKRVLRKFMWFNTKKGYWACNKR